jgi:hypothetical protein
MMNWNLLAWIICLPSTILTMYSAYLLYTNPGVFAFIGVITGLIFAALCWVQIARCMSVLMIG